jgi:hypothetical protein
MESAAASARQPAHDFPRRGRLQDHAPGKRQQRQQARAVTANCCPVCTGAGEGPVVFAPADQVVCALIEQAYAGYHAWVSDEGWWYAVKTGPAARGWAATVDGPGPVELEQALREAEDAA